MDLGTLLMVLTTLPSGQPFSIPIADKHPLVAQAGDEAAVKAAGLPTSGPGLVEFFRKRAAVPDAARLTVLLKQLTDSKAEQRDQATAELIGHGPTAVPALRQALNNAENPDLATRARQCLAAIEGPNAAVLTQSQVRLLAGQRPAGAVEALLRFLPFAENEEVVGQVQSALATLASRGGEPPETAGKPDEDLFRALADPIPVRRAVAATVLARIGGSACFSAIRPLLKDPRPSVRLKVAMALVESQDAEAVVFLIDLLPDLPAPQQQQVESYLTALAGEWAVVTPRGHDPLARQLKRDLWQTWWRGTSGPMLLKEIQQRTLSDEERASLLALVQKLDDQVPEERDQTCDALLRWGPRIVPLLRQAASHASPKQQPCLTKCLAVLEKDALPLPTAVPRLLALRRPEGTLAALLAYLPYTDHEGGRHQISEQITLLGWHEGKADPLILKALQDPVNIRRALAAVLLIRQGTPEQKAAACKRLQDPNAEVRLSVALTLAEMADKEAVPVLIALLAELPFEEGWPIEEYLTNLAGDNSPTVPLLASVEGRKRCRDAWARWWSSNSGKVQLARLGQDQANLGLLLVIENYNATTRSGSITELDRAGKTRWKIDRGIFPMDAQVLPGQRVLIAEQNTNKVTERDLTGNILWEKPIVQPFFCRRLRNGNTFVASRNAIYLLDPRGKEVLTHQRVNDTILAAQHLRDGQIAYVTYQGNYYRLDSTGKEVKHFRVPIVPGVGVNGADVLPGDRVVLSHFGTNKVIEHGPDGRTVWEATVPQPATLSCLPNGHTLVVSGGLRVVELDRAGKIVQEIKDLTIRPWRVYRR